MASAIMSLSPRSLASPLRLPAAKGARRRTSLPIPSNARRSGASAATCALLSPSDVSSLLLDTSMLAFVSAELPQGIQYNIEVSDFRMSEQFIKSFYMIFSCVFCWGAVVFGSMNDAYYESDEYRNAGGNGTQFWMYERAEEEEELAREELWRDELRQEIEEKIGEIKELEAGQEAERAKEMV